MNNETIDGVPLALLKNIEMTWRQASGFSNKANDIIVEGLGQLRALLAKQATCAKSQVEPAAQRQALPERMTYARAGELSDNPMTYMNAYDAGLEAGLAARSPVERAQVAEIVEFGFGLKEISWVGGKMPEVGTKLYICPELPSILDLSYEEAHKVDCVLPAARLTDGSELAGLRFFAPTPGPIEPILVEAVAVTRECDEDGLRLEWLLEGGIAALELPGTVLFVAHGTVTNDEGHGYVITVEGGNDE